eukprot:351346-Chlamydomonas_euryale.AAC.8
MLQVTASEAGELKRLFVLDADDGWRVLEEVPMHVGARHVRANGLQALQALAADLQVAPTGEPHAAGERLAEAVAEAAAPGTRAGDHVKVHLDPGVAEQEWRSARDALTAVGVRVEVVLRPESARPPRMQQAEDKDVLTLLAEYADTHGMSNGARLAVRAAAFEALVPVPVLTCCRCYCYSYC